GITLTEALVFEHPTIEDLVAHFLSVLCPEMDAPARVPQAAPKAAPMPPAPASGSGEEAWSEQLDAVAALDQEDLLRQLRGEG
ncbi:MAG: hypothetical protein ACKO0M_15365, partial [Cyanobium sp.]